MAIGICTVCGETESGTRLNGEFVGDDCMNSPSRTRPWLAGTRSQNPAEGPGHVPLNRVIIREGNDEGPVVNVPNDENVKPVTEAEIAQAREEHKNDPVYVPTNERTLAKVGALVMPEVKAEADAKKQSIKKPSKKRTARSAAKPKAGSKKPNKGARKTTRRAAKSKVR